MKYTNSYDHWQIHGNLNGYALCIGRKSMQIKDAYKYNTFAIPMPNHNFELTGGFLGNKNVVIPKGNYFMNLSGEIKPL